MGTKALQDCLFTFIKKIIAEISKRCEINTEAVQTERAADNTTSITSSRPELT